MLYLHIADGHLYRLKWLVSLFTVAHKSPGQVIPNNLSFELWINSPLETDLVAYVVYVLTIVCLSCLCMASSSKSSRVVFLLDHFTFFGRPFRREKYSIILQARGGWVVQAINQIAKDPQQEHHWQIPSPPAPVIDHPIHPSIHPPIPYWPQEPVTFKPPARGTCCCQQGQDAAHQWNSKSMNPSSKRLVP